MYLIKLFMLITVWEKEKMLVSSIVSFPQFFSKGFPVRVIKSTDGEVKGWLFLSNLRNLHCLSV